MVELYGLLHVSDEGRYSPNLRSGSYEKAIRTYFGDAVTLYNSLRAAGCGFTLLTNDRYRLEDVNRKGFKSSISIREISFQLRVPKAIGYYSAHHKIDVYRWFGNSAPGDYAILVDVDVVALRAPSSQFSACVEAGMPMIYDISDHVFPLFGGERILSDLRLLTELPLSIGHWYGGEFIGGPPKFFRTLANEIDHLWDRYCSRFESLHHQGDEMLTSAALCKMVMDGCVAIDVGPIGGIGRYGSWLPLHPQKPFWWFEECFLLHLSLDKEYLAKWANRRPFQSDHFLRSYRRYLLSRRLKALVICLGKVATRNRHSFSSKLEARRLRLIGTSPPSTSAGSISKRPKSFAR
jgi:hypothetical protein